MHVGELAALTGVSVRSLHYYEEMGLLHAQRQENGYRSYEASAIEQVNRICTLLNLGFSTQDIRLLAPCLEQQETGAPLCVTALSQYQRKLAEIDEHIRLLQHLRERVEQHIQAAAIHQIEESLP